MDLDHVDIVITPTGKTIPSAGTKNSILVTSQTVR